MALGKNFHVWTTFLVATEAALCVTLGEIGTQKCLALCVTVATIQFGSVVAMHYENGRTRGRKRKCSATEEPQKC